MLVTTMELFVRSNLPAPLVERLPTLTALGKPACARTVAAEIVRLAAVRVSGLAARTRVAAPVTLTAPAPVKLPAGLLRVWVPPANSSVAPAETLNVPV